MLTNEIRNQIDQIWNAFWSGGISNPLEVIEQITYLLFIKRLDELQTLEELKAKRLKAPIERRFFPQGEDDHPRSPRSYEDYRWSRFKHFAPADMYQVVGEHIFPFLRTLGGNGTTYAHHMKDARFTIPTPGLLARVVDMIDQVPMEERDTKGDLYEYMLAKIATAGQNGQFRTPRHAPCSATRTSTSRWRFTLISFRRCRRIHPRGWQQRFSVGEKPERHRRANPVARYN